MCISFLPALPGTCCCFFWFAWDLEFGEQRYRAYIGMNIGVILGLYGGYVGIVEQTTETAL